MKYYLLFSLVLVAYAVTAYPAENNEKKVVCYYGRWSVYRPGDGKFDIDNIDPSLCSHLIYSFVGISGSEIVSLDKWADLPDGLNGFGKFTALRKKNPKLKIMVAIGGWNEGSKKYSDMARDPAMREAFADSAVKFLKKYQFDGLDFDWEYPAQREGSSSADVENFVHLLKALKSRFTKEQLLLSAAVAAPQPTASKSYNIPKISQYLDFINLMAYDYYGQEQQVNIHAPLYSGPNENKELSIHATINYWLSQGAPNNKLVLGLPTYGKSFRLADPNLHDIGAPATGPGQPGPYTRAEGILGYNEICVKQLKEGWKKQFDTVRHGPYSYKGDQWVGYDDVKSINEKVALINKLNIAGAMIWSMETDDFHGVCGPKNPLLNAINSTLDKGKFISNPEISDPDTSDAEEMDNPPVLPEPNDENENSPYDDGVPMEIYVGDNDLPPPSDEAETSEPCENSLYLPIPGSCSYIQCQPIGNGNFIKHSMVCQPGLCFNPQFNVCDYE